MSEGWIMATGQISIKQVVEILILYLEGIEQTPYNSQQGRAVIC